MTLQFTFYINDVPTNVTSATLYNPDETGSGGPVAGTYGVKRTDNAAVVVAAGTAMTLVSGTTGEYSYTFAEPAAGLTYKYWVKIVYAGKTFFLEKQKSAAGVSEPIGLYYTWDEFVNRWGLKNITVASNKDNDDLDPNMTACQSAINFGDQKIAAALSGGVYALPLDFTPNGDVVPEFVKEWSMVHAFNRLYGARGINEKDKLGLQYREMVREANNEMQLYRLCLPGFQLPATIGRNMSASAVSQMDVLVARGYGIYPDRIPDSPYSILWR